MLVSDIQEKIHARRLALLAEAQVLAEAEAALASHKPSSRHRAKQRITIEEVRDAALAVPRDEIITAPLIAKRIGVSVASQRRVKDLLGELERRGTLAPVGTVGWRFAKPRAGKHPVKVTYLPSVVPGPAPSSRRRRIRTGDKDVDRVLNAARKQGYKVVPTRGGHWKVTSPTGGAVVVTASGKDHRAASNSRARLRQIGLAA